MPGMETDNALTERKRVGRPPHVLLTPTLQEQILEYAVEAPSEKALAEKFGTNMVTLNFWLTSNPAFFDAFARARKSWVRQYADRLMTVTDEEPDVMKARLLSENWRWRLSRSLRQEFGDSIDVNVTERVEVGSILSEARARLRPMRDSATIEDAVIVENQSVSTSLHTDCQSGSGLNDLLA